PPGGRRYGRPEAGHDSGAGHCRRRRLSRGRTSYCGGGRSTGGGGRRRRRNCGCATLNGMKGKPMAKGYWLALVDISDPEAYKAYVAAIQDVLRRFGGRYVIRAGRSETMEGELRSRL